MHAATLPSTDLDSYLHRRQSHDLLHFITCGSVDDGKSTLIGRMFYESGLIHEDQLAALHTDSRARRMEDGALDFSLLVDGLAAEREQGITIDVAYRFFSTHQRNFIVADTPGHEQYTRNMATGASKAELAVVMVDARKGISSQTRRHSFIVSLFGVKHVVLAINKMDLLGFDEATFHAIRDEFTAFAKDLALGSIQVIPMSALKGDNVIRRSANMPWYKGPALLEYLETIQLNTVQTPAPFRMPVQWVNRPHQDFRGFSGLIVSGQIQPGAEVKILPGGQRSSVSQIVTYDGPLDEARAGQSITLTLKDEIDISRGSVITADEDAACEVAKQFETTLLWMDEAPMVSNRQYILKSGSSSALCSAKKPKYGIDVNTMKPMALIKPLRMNEIACCELALDRPIPFVPYQVNREMGGFVLIDRHTHATVAAGFFHFALRRSVNVKPQALMVSSAMRASLKNQTPKVVWLTGLPSSGKSTIANQVELALNAQGKHTILLDGDNIRWSLNRDLGFTDADRAENIRRVAEVAKLMLDAGLITLVAMISPFASEREMAKSIIGEPHFLEVFVEAPLAVAEERDVKGLYKKARRGEIKNFTGIGSAYEAPASPALAIDTTRLTPAEAANLVIEKLEASEM